jgi:hypothetical protein
MVPAVRLILVARVASEQLVSVYVIGPEPPVALRHGVSTGRDTYATPTSPSGKAGEHTGHDIEDSNMLTFTVCVDLIPSLSVTVTFIVPDLGAVALPEMQSVLFVVGAAGTELIVFRRPGGRFVVFHV